MNGEPASCSPQAPQPNELPNVYGAPGLPLALARTCPRVTSPFSVVPWLEGASPIIVCTRAASPSPGYVVLPVLSIMYRGIMPPWECPTMSTCAGFAPAVYPAAFPAASTVSGRTVPVMNDASCLAEFS